MDQGRLAPEALLFSSRFYCLSAEGWLCEPCVYVCVCVCVCVCSSERTGGGKGQEPLLRRHPHPIPRPPRSVSIQVLGRSRWKGMPFSPPLPKHIYSCGGRLGGDCLDQRNDLGQGHTALVPHWAWVLSRWLLPGCWAPSLRPLFTPSSLSASYPSSSSSFSPTSNPLNKAKGNWCMELPTTCILPGAWTDWGCLCSWYCLILHCKQLLIPGR